MYHNVNLKKQITEIQCRHSNKCNICVFSRNCFNIIIIIIIITDTNVKLFQKDYWSMYLIFNFIFSHQICKSNYIPKYKKRKKRHFKENNYSSRHIFLINWKYFFFMKFSFHFTVNYFPFSTQTNIRTSIRK